jgi:hypothetical protein
VAFSITFESLLRNAYVGLAEKAFGGTFGVAALFAIVTMVYLDLNSTLFLQTLGLTFNDVDGSGF